MRPAEVGCVVLGCKNPPYANTPLLQTCSKHVSEWEESGEHRRARADKREDRPRAFVLAFNDWVRRIIAEELNARDGT